MRDYNFYLFLILVVVIRFHPSATTTAASYHHTTTTMDHPIASSSNHIYYLDGNDWIATTTSSNNHSLKIQGNVPGDLITDLQRANMIHDPYYELNWIHNSSLWSSTDWTYERNFTIPTTTTNNNRKKKNQSSAVWLLVFDGVKMGARITVNHHYNLGIVKDQFLRYIFELPFSILHTNNKNNTLQVTFDDNIDEEGRFMACTGGWDWAPYSYTWKEKKKKKNGTVDSRIPSFSKGIWKSVYLVEVPTLAITHMTPHTKYLGSYPTKPLLNDDDADDDVVALFAVNVTVHLWVPPSSSSSSDDKSTTTTTRTGHLKVMGDWGPNNNITTNTTTTSNTTGTIRLSEGNTVISLELKAQYPNEIHLWWPAGMRKKDDGQQQSSAIRTLYNVTATWVDDTNDDSIVSTTRRIGFRVFALVTRNDTDIIATTTVNNNVTTTAQDNNNKKNGNSNSSSSGTHGMFFRINGAAIYSRGANVVPMEELEGRHYYYHPLHTNSKNTTHDDSHYRILVKSAVDAGMNTLRVWGGGIFFPRDFYDACDEYGILLYHDMAYASVDGVSQHGPNEQSKTQEAELRYQIRRLSHHPSIVLWDGVNEVVVTPHTPSEVFATFVMTIVAQEDQSRAIWPSSPASGWKTGIDPLYGTPGVDESPLSTFGGGQIWDQGIETHAPYQLGSGWPTVNGDNTDDCWDRWYLVHVPIRLDPKNTKFGVHEKNVYASEFGVTGSPSFESLSATLARDHHHWGIHGGSPPDNCTGACQEQRTCTGTNVMAQRNYACDAGIRLWFGSSSSSSNMLAVGLDDVGEYALKGQTYLCQIVQALDQKSVIEERRGKNQFGALVWMLNDIWPSISWGSLEYSSTPDFTPGQLVGGRWKPMHYFYKRSLFKDVMATCGRLSSSSSIQKDDNNEDDPSWICYIKNDRPARRFRGTITLTSYTFTDSTTTPNVFFKKNVELSDGPGSVQWFHPTFIQQHDGIGSSTTGIQMPNPNTTLVVCTVYDNDHDDNNTGGGVVVISEHLLTLTMPKYFLHLLPRAKVTARVVDVVATTSSNRTNYNNSISDDDDGDGIINRIDIYVTSDRLALWVVLTSSAQGRFSDNAFLLLPDTTKIIQFVPFSSSSSSKQQHLEMLQRTLRVESLSDYVDTSTTNQEEENRIGSGGSSTIY